VTTATGKTWALSTLEYWLGGGGRREQLEELHRTVLDDAKRRGLTNREAAEEFNRREIPRERNREWTADVVRQRRAQLKRRWTRKAKGPANSSSPEDVDPQP
jgi:hypothetical protein